MNENFRFLCDFQTKDIDLRSVFNYSNLAASHP